MKLIHITILAEEPITGTQLSNDEISAALKSLFWPQLDVKTITVTSTSA